MRGPGGDKADLVALSLAMGKSWAETASSCNVCETTIATWLHDKGFKTRVHNFRLRAIQEGHGALVAALKDSVALAHLIVTDDNEQTNVRLAAALGIIDRIMKLGDYADIVNRVKALEDERDGNTGENPKVGEPGSDTHQSTDATREPSGQVPEVS